MLIPFRKGDRFTMCLWAEGDGTSEALDYLESLSQGGKRQKEDYVSLVKHRIERMANHGAIFNQEHSKELEDGIYEFKGGNGARLLWFYDPLQKAVVICTHGFHKPPSNRGYRAQIRKAKMIRDRHENGES